MPLDDSDDISHNDNVEIVEIIDSDDSDEEEQGLGFRITIQSLKRGRENSSACSARVDEGEMPIKVARTEDASLVASELQLVNAAISSQTVIAATDATVPDPAPFSGNTAELSTSRDEVQNVLDCVPAPKVHESMSRWIIFSDLHVKDSTIEVCEEVLIKVHEAARERQAGVIFLGDFWHIRGALNVELLNRILSSLAQWTQPLVMIPGNHDQVQLSSVLL